MLYDDLSSDYDRFVNWQSRLAVELPFLESQLKGIGARRVLDAACGTGMHTLALARLGFEAAGADLSPAMVERARANASTSGVDARFEVAGFGELKRTFKGESFDAVLCLGNSLPHVLTPELLLAAAADFAACLKPGGLVLIQNRNFDAIIERHERWMEPQAAREGESEWLFLRFYDFNTDGLLTFNVVTLHREGTKAWDQSVLGARLRPLLAEEMKSTLTSAGFEAVACLGDMTGTPFEPKTSGNLVVTARRSRK